MGRRWRDIHPQDKPNWDTLNESRRRYAVEQYNLARVRRGLPVDHPVPGEPEYNHRGEQPEDPLDKLDEPIEGEEELRDQLAKDLGEAEHQGNTEDGTERPSDQHHSPVHSESRQRDMSMEVSSSQQGGNKRTIDQTGDAAMDGGNKRRAGGTKLPGTAKGQGNNAQGEGGPRDFELPSPYNGIKSYIRHFRKVHRFLSWGFAYNTVEFTQYYYCTSPLLNIPWDWLYMYVNPAEYSTLGRSAGIDHCKVSVIQRNVRIAFPTNSTATNLATLNQNKNIVYAKGLNMLGWGQNGAYTTFQTNQPMIPTDFSTNSYATHTGIAQEMYFNPTNAQFGTETPRHQFGIPQVLPMYYIAQLARAVPATAQGELDGWQCYQNHIHEVDADSTAGNCIAEMHYEPKVGLCTLPQPVVDRTVCITPAAPRVYNGSGNLRRHRTTITRTAESGDANNIRPSTYDSIVAQHGLIVGGQANQYNLTNNVQLIEKSLMYHKGVFRTFDPQIQPSLHVGVQPTPALTSSAITGASNSSFTDTQAYFEVICEIQINENYNTIHAGRAGAHVGPRDAWFQINSNTNQLPDCFRPTYQGLYVSAN